MNPKLWVFSMDHCGTVDSPGTAGEGSGDELQRPQHAQVTTRLAGVGRGEGCSTLSGGRVQLALNCEDALVAELPGENGIELKPALRGPANRRGI